MNIEPLDKTKHNRSQFDCGVTSLNDYLQKTANQQAKKDNARTFVLTENHNQIVGFYTLIPIQFDLSQLPKNLQKKHQGMNIAMLIARLAIDKNYQRQGYGKILLIDALKRLLNVSETAVFPVILVDAKDGAADFYEKYQFIPLPDSGNRLFVTLQSVREAFSDD